MKFNEINKKKLITFILAVTIFILLVLIFIKALSGGYSSATKKILKDNNLYSAVRGFDYSKTLDEAVKNNNYKVEYLKSYIEIEYNEDFKDFIKHVNNLLDAKYTPSEISNITKNIKEESIGYLTKKRINDIEKFISDNLFKIENSERYADYQSKNEYEAENVIMHVNIGLDKEFYSEINEIKNTEDKLILVNKYNKLPENYEANDLVEFEDTYSYNNQSMKTEAAKNIKALIDNARKEGYTLMIVSGYRTNEYQKNLYDTSVSKDGKDYADMFSARPGHSEHQTGLTVDISDKEGVLKGFEETDVYKWVKNQAYKYGYIERYPKNREVITGYGYEPWHYRYVGIEAAAIIHKEGITLEEYHVKYLGYSS